ncbi:MAG: acetolactate synthase small subunit [Eubacteriales bacterium]|nr:acetolactate synthase small subunit [Eubacteriales bacterium]
MQRVISFIVSNQPGVLCRISGLVSRRGFNIESLTVGVTDDPALSRITIVMFADDSVIEQVIKQFDKLLDVKAIKEIPRDKGTLREIALVKVGAVGIDRKDFMEVVNSRWGVVLDMGEHTTTVQLTGTISYINESIEAFKKFGIVEIARTGMVALESGDTQLYKGDDY